MSVLKKYVERPSTKVVSTEGLMDDVKVFFKLRNKVESDDKYTKVKFYTPKKFEEGAEVKVVWEYEYNMFDISERNPDPLLKLSNLFYLNHIGKDIDNIYNKVKSIKGKLDSFTDKFDKAASKAEDDGGDTFYNVTGEYIEVIEKVVGSSLKNVFSERRKHYKFDCFGKKKGEVTFKLKDASTYNENVSEFNTAVVNARKYSAKLNEIIDIIEKPTLASQDFGDGDELALYNSWEEFWDLINIQHDIKSLDALDNWVKNYTKSIGLLEVSNEGIIDSIKNLFKGDPISELNHDGLVSLLDKQLQLINKHKTESNSDAIFKTSAYGSAFQLGKRHLTKVSDIINHIDNTTKLLNKFNKVDSFFNDLVSVMRKECGKYDEDDEFYSDISRNLTAEYIKGIIKLGVDIEFGPRESGEFDSKFYKTTLAKGYRSEVMLGNEIFIASIGGGVINVGFDYGKLNTKIASSDINACDNIQGVYNSLVKLKLAIDNAYKNIISSSAILESGYNDIAKKYPNFSYIAEELMTVKVNTDHMLVTIDEVLRSANYMAKYLLDSLGVTDDVSTEGFFDYTLKWGSVIKMMFAGEGVGKIQKYGHHNADGRITQLKSWLMQLPKDNYDPGSVLTKGHEPYMVYKGKQVTTPIEYERAILELDKQLAPLYLNVQKLNKDLIKVTDDTEVISKVEQAVGKDFFTTFEFKGSLKDVEHVDGCENPQKIANALIRIMGWHLGRLHRQAENLSKNKGVTDKARQGGKAILELVNAYYTFSTHAAYWVVNSIKNAADAVSTESLDDSVEWLYNQWVSLEDEEQSADSPAEETSTDEDTDTKEEESSDDKQDGENTEETSEPDAEEETSDDGQTDEQVNTEPSEETPEDTTEEDERPEERRPEERREEVRLDNPEDEKEKIALYLEPLVGENINELTLYSAGEINRPLYHVSMNPNIERFTPQVSKRTLGKEDRSVPRISTSTSLVGCLNGYQSMVSDMEGRSAKNFNGIFKVYELPYQYAVKPSRKLLSDVDFSDEYWLVSWKKETYATYPIKIADFTIPKIEKVYGNDGKDETFHVYVKVFNGSLYIDHQRKLDRGFFHLTLKGYTFRYPLKNNNLIDIETITENEYNRVTSLSMMIKTK